jgi:D-alanyl-D-alanine carboxypeptidase/D-alanyl-D-alanine-endopeptidase (penicillin-binding protein 4)
MRRQQVRSASEKKSEGGILKHANIVTALHCLTSRRQAALTRRLASATLVLLAMTVMLVGAQPAVAGTVSLSARIAAVLVKDHLSPKATSISIYDQTSGNFVYRLYVGTLRAPASNVKLATATSALTRWGADYRFKTELYATGLPTSSATGAGEITGNIYLKGYGDPSLATSSYAQRVLHMHTATIESFVAALQKRGINRIDGRVIADGSYFDQRTSAPGWKSDFASDECGTLAGLTLNEGADNGRSVKSSPLYAADALTTALRKAGIIVVDNPHLGTVPTTATLVDTEYSAPLATLIAHMDKVSDNFFAEMLTKGLGASFAGQGSTAAGVRVISATLRACGLAPSWFRLYDGSGLSYWDRINASGMIKLLRYAARPDSAAFLTSLSVAGVDGTLRQRMRATRAQDNLRAKTGSLDIASCLSGYVTSANRHKLIFSLLMNGAPVNYSAAIQAQNAIGVVLADAIVPR